MIVHEQLTAMERWEVQLFSWLLAILSCPPLSSQFPWSYVISKVKHFSMEVGTDCCHVTVGFQNLCITQKRQLNEAMLYTNTSVWRSVLIVSMLTWVCCTTISWKGRTGRSKSEAYSTEMMMFTLSRITWCPLTSSRTYMCITMETGCSDRDLVSIGCLFEWWVRHAPWPLHRDRHKALQQRFTSLQVSGNMWQDLAVMREGVEIETTAMARRRLLMNYEWWVC